MAVLTYGQRKKIESHIRNYHRYMEEVCEWREMALTGPSRDLNQFKQTQRRSDPTAAAAIHLTSPPMRIREMELWAVSVDAVRRRTAGEGMGWLFERWFWRPPCTVTAAALAIGVSEKQFYNWLNEIIIQVALLAAQTGIFIFEEDIADSLNAAHCANNAEC